MLDNAKAKFNDGKFDEALTILNTILTHSEFELEAILMRGVVYRKLSKLDLSYQDFDRLINLLPNEAEVYAERAITLLNMNRFDASLEDMNKAIDIEPKNPYRYSCRAYLKDRIGDTQGAMSDYEKAVELDPEDEIAYNNLGLILEKTGRKKAAKKNFEQSNTILENKYGIKIGNGDVRPYTFKTEGSKNDSKTKKQDRKGKLTWKEYIHTF